MKFTYKGTKCEIRFNGILWLATISGIETYTGIGGKDEWSTRKRLERFIDQIISNAAKESGK